MILARPLARASAALLATALSAACLPDPRGRCARDADCAAGAAGSFCAEGVCQGAPTATVEVPAAALARSATAQVRVRVTRAHGGPAAATARFEAGALAGTSTREADGALRLDVPCGFAPAGADGSAAFAVFVADDQGHETRIAAAIHVDDRGPAIAVDPASLPASPALRGSRVPLRVVLTDPAGAGSVRFSVGTATPHDAALQTDGSFRAEVDTREAPAAADHADVALLAKDALGNESRASTSFALTRVKWVAHGSGGSATTSLALSRDSLVALTSDKRILRATRDRGVLAEATVPLSSDFHGNLVIDGAFVYTALVDGRVCKLGLDGTVAFCCDSEGPIDGAPALGTFPGHQIGDPPSAAVIVATSGPTGRGGRLVAFREEKGGCVSFISSTLTQQSLGTPAIAADGTVFVAGRGLVAADVFDGRSWAPPQTFARSTTYLGQPALAAPVQGGAGAGQRLVLSTRASAVGALLFPLSSTPGVPPSAVTEVFSSSDTTGQDLPSTSPVLTEDGTAIVGVPDDAALVAIGPDGARRWSAALPGRPAAAPVLGDGGLVYAATDDGTVTALDGATGARVWSAAAGGPIHATPVLGCDGILYGATDTGGLFALVTDSTGPSAGPWPREGHDPRGSGDARRVLRGAGGSCVEE